jgi:uncharacterized protein
VITVHETASGITFGVKVQPRAWKNAIVGELGKGLKIAVTAPPINGRANQACIDFFADLLNVPRSAVTILSGESSRNKVMPVTGISVEALQSKLHI